MLNIVSELNEFITVLYGKEPTMNKTWQELYPDAFRQIAKDLFRFYVSSVRAASPCDRMHVMTFLVYEERTHINNAKFIHPPLSEQAMRLLELSSAIHAKIQLEYNLRISGKAGNRPGD